MTAQIINLAEHRAKRQTGIRLPPLMKACLFNILLWFGMIVVAWSVFRGALA